MTVRRSPEKRTRAPLLLGCSPSPPRRTPALTRSSLYLPIAASSSWLGSLPASESLLAFTMIMNRMFVSPVGWIGHFLVEQAGPKSTTSSTEDHHALFCRDSRGQVTRPAHARRVTSCCVRACTCSALLAITGFLLCYVFTGDGRACHYPSEPNRSCHGLTCFVIKSPFVVHGSPARRSTISDELDARTMRSASRVPSNGPTRRANRSSNSASMNAAWPAQSSWPSRGLEWFHAAPRDRKTANRRSIRYSSPPACDTQSSPRQSLLRPPNAQAERPAQPVRSACCSAA